MKIRPLNNGVSGAAGYGVDTQSTVKPESQKAPQVQNEDAARVSVSSNSGSSASDRSAYIASIKSEVDSGTYRRDSEKVAEALYRDLF